MGEFSTSTLFRKNYYTRCPNKNFVNTALIHTVSAYSQNTLKNPTFSRPQLTRQPSLQQQRTLGQSTVERQNPAVLQRIRLKTLLRVFIEKANGIRA
jgi:hypothetical protein